MDCQHGLRTPVVYYLLLVGFGVQCSHIPLKPETEADIFIKNGSTSDATSHNLRTLFDEPSPPPNEAGTSSRLTDDKRKYNSVTTDTNKHVDESTPASVEEFGGDSEYVEYASEKPRKLFSGQVNIGRESSSLDKINRENSVSYEEENGDPFAHRPVPVGESPTDSPALEESNRRSSNNGNGNGGVSSQGSEQSGVYESFPSPDNLTWNDADMYEGDFLDDDEVEMLPVEQKLMDNLLRYYERSVRPVRNASDTVLVRMGMTLTQIFDMDEKNQVLVTNVWLDQQWDDMFMKWDPEQYGGLKMLRLPCHKLWLPDIVLYNNAAEYTDGLMPANAMITYEGDVFWPVPTKLQSTCKVDVTYFPFDDQFCKLKFGSWTYDGFQVDMTNRTTEVDLSNYVSNGEWELVEIVIKRNVVFYACCPEPFPDVTFTIHIRRRTIYYLYNVIFPCVMMSALTLLVFCLPPDSGEKITLGITVLLAFSVFLLRMGEDLPETSEFIPLLSIYLTIVMGMTSVSVIMTVFVLNLHYRGPNESTVPSWLRDIFVRHRTKRGLCLNRNANFGDEYISETSTHYVKNVSLRMTIENLAQELTEELDNNCTSDFISEASTTNTDHYGGSQMIVDREFHQTTTPDNSNSAPPRPYLHQGNVTHQPSNPAYHRGSHSRTNEDILEALKKIIDRYERDDNQEYVMFEWRQVAVGVDRILFWIFFIGTLSSTIIVLIVAPLTKWL